MASVLKIVGMTSSAYSLRELVGRPDVPAVDFYSAVILLSVAEAAIAWLLLTARAVVMCNGILMLGTVLYAGYVVMRCGKGLAPSVCPCFGGLVFAQATCFGELAKAVALFFASTIAGVLWLRSEQRRVVARGCASLPSPVQHSQSPK
jgi:hypothetical protein